MVITRYLPFQSAGSDAQEQSITIAWTLSLCCQIAGLVPEVMHHLLGESALSCKQCLRLTWHKELCLLAVLLSTPNEHGWGSSGRAQMLSTCPCTFSSYLNIFTYEQWWDIYTFGRALLLLCIRSFHTASVFFFRYLRQSVLDTWNGPKPYGCLGCAWSMESIRMGWDGLDFVFGSALRTTVCVSDWRTTRCG